MTIPIAHDYICPWCWIAYFQTKRLKEEFPVTFDWLSYELMPEDLPWDDSPRPPEVQTNRPRTPSRMDLAWAAAGIEKPTSKRPRHMRSHNALEATEYFKSLGDPEPFIYAMYEAYWQEGLEINDIEVIKGIAQPFVQDMDDLVAAIEEKRFKDSIVPFDEAAYSNGVYNVPTYWIGGERYAEQPTLTLAKVIRGQL